MSATDPLLSTNSILESDDTMAPSKVPVSHLKRLLPVLQWLPSYNLKCLEADALAGITVGLMVVPQSISYANIAGLPIQVS